MAMQKMTLVVSILLITVGTGLLLSALNVAEEIDWVWVLGLLVSGILLIAMVGLDKITFVAGLYLIISSCLSAIRQLGHLSFNHEIPILVIIVGVLSLVARHRSIPKPKWIDELPGDDADH